MKLNPEYDPQITLDFINLYCGNSFEFLVPIDDLKPTHPKLPKQWVPLIGLDRDSSIELLWGKAAPFLPGFCDQVRKRLIGLFFAESFLGPVLVYFLEQWNFNDRLDGTMIAGPPATNSQISTLEREFGKMPPSLCELWKSHSFLELRAAANIISASISNPIPALNVSYLGHKKSTQNPGTTLDCFEIASLNKDEAYAITRPLGQTHWTTQIVDASRKGDSFATSIYSNIDQLFVGYLEEIGL